MNRVSFALLLLPLVPMVPSLAAQEEERTLAPPAWPEGEYAKYDARQDLYDDAEAAAHGERGLIVGTTGPLGVRAGFEALAQGGTAIDAACTAALTQIARIGGATISYAGVLTVVYYEAETGEVHTMVAPFAAPFEEDDPYSIPADGSPSGRTAMVPGFMKGIEAVHERFGALPFARLFDPAIHVAEEGFVVGERLNRWLAYREPVLTRLPATRAVFTDDEGKFVTTGDLFRQPALARTLRAIAADGADHMYEGPWAQALVNAVRADGGKITARDLAEYEVAWTKPTRGSYRDLEVCGPGLPSTGTFQVLESLHLLELADPAQHGHYSESADALYWLMQSTRITYFLNSFGDAWVHERFPGLPTDFESRASRKNARAMWEKMRDPAWTSAIQDARRETPENPHRSGGHSAAIVAVDAHGNVAAICHSINTMLWGSTGLVVEGVSIPDAAWFQQPVIAQAGPGGHVTNGMNPVLVLRDGKPILASSCIGSGLHDTTIGNLHNVLDFDFDPAESQAQPQLLMPYYDSSLNDPSQVFRAQVVCPDDYPAEVLAGVRELGQQLHEVPAPMGSRHAGQWIGITIDPETGQRCGGAPRGKNGVALAER